MVEHAGGVVENVAVDLARGDDDLQRVAERVRGGDHGGDDEAEGTPAELDARSVLAGMDSRDGLWELRITYGRGGFHAQDEGVLGQVARVGKGVLLPHLSEESVQRAHVGLVEGVVPLEEEMNTTTWKNIISHSFSLYPDGLLVNSTGILLVLTQHKPHDSDHVIPAYPRMDALDQGVGDGEDDSAAGEEDAQDGGHAHVIGQVARDLDLERVVGVRRMRDLRGIVRDVVRERHCE